ncbi:LytR C-terminal domain-containing protein [Corynebacterium sp. S7]
MTNVNPDNQDSQPESKSTGGAHAAKSTGAASSFPFRGLAMVLITVAVLLGLWGVYALTQGDGSQNAASKQTTTSQQQSPAASPAPNASSTPGAAPTSAGAPASEGNTPANQANQPANSTGAQNGAQPGTSSGAQNGAQPGTQAGGQGAAAANQPRADVVNVYNNSTVQGLASNVSTSLRDRGYDIQITNGNITEDQMILPKTTVFYDPAVSGAETRARELADLVGGVAQQNVANLPKEATEGGALTLVLAGEVNL